MSSSSFLLMKLPYIPLKEVTMMMPLCQLLHITSDPKFYRLMGIRKNFELFLDEYRWSVHTDDYECVDYSLGLDGKAVDMMNRWEKVQKAIPGSITTFTICRRVVKDLLVCENIPKEVDVFIFDSAVDWKGNELPKEDPDHYSWYWQESSEEYKQELKKTQKEENILIEKLLNLIDVRKGTVLRGPGRPKTLFAFEKEYINVEYSDWVTLEMLSKLKSRIARFNRSDLSNQEANQFLKDLKAGKICQNLEILTIDGYKQDASWNPESVMEGLDAKKESDFNIYLSEKPSLLVLDHFFPIRSYLEVWGIDLTGAYTFTRIDGFTCSVVFEKQRLILYVYNREENDVDGSKKRRLEEYIEKRKRRSIYYS